MEIISIENEKIDLDLVLSQIDFFSELNDRNKDKLKRHVDLVKLDSQEVLLKEGDFPDYIYLVYSGRLAAYKTDNQEETIIGYIKHGETIGELAIVTDLPRLASIKAIRKSILVRINSMTIKQIMTETPDLMQKMFNLITQRMRRLISRNSNSPLAENKIQIIAVISAGQSHGNAHFMNTFMPILTQYETCLELSEESFNQLLDVQPDSDLNTSISSYMQRSQLLAKLENKYPMIVLNCGRELSEWSLFCIENTDCFLFVAEDNASHNFNPLEHYIYKTKNRFDLVDKKLLCIHEDANALPHGTYLWMENRDIKSVHHVHYEKPQTLRRLARVLTNQCIGVVLGGGGVLGLAHIGVLRAFEEAGIEIDAIGGVSSGAIIAALYALGLDHHGITDQLNYLMKKKSRTQFLVWQIPFSSLIKPHQAKKMFKQLFLNYRIEDLWMHFFCVACNLNTTKDAVFDQGSLADSVLASNSLPGILSPLPIKGELFVDGGVTNSMPGDVMKEKFSGITIGVNVSLKRNIDSEAIQDNFPSTFEIMLNYLNPFKEYYKVPSIPDIITRAVIIGNKRKLAEVKTIVDYLIEPDFSSIKKPGYKKLMELIELGYVTAKKEIEKWQLEASNFNSEADHQSFLKNGIREKDHTDSTLNPHRI